MKALTVARLLGLLRGYRLAMAVAVLCALLYTLSALVPPLLIRSIIRDLVEARGSAATVGAVVLALAGLAVLRAAFRYGDAIISHVVAYRILHELTVRVYAHLQVLPHRFFTQQRTGALVSQALSDVETVEVFIAHALGQLAQALLVPLSMLAVLFVLNWKLALVAAAPMPLVGWLVLVFTPRTRAAWRQVRLQLAELNATVQENIAGMAVIKAFTRERERLALVRSTSERFRDDIIAANVWSLVPASSIELLAGLTTTLVVWRGGLAGLDGELSAADLFVFVAYLGHIYQPLLQLATINEGVQQALASAERIFALLDTQPDIVDPPTPVIPRQPRWTVSFEHVTFGYDPDRPVLHDISFEVDEGETVALVGPTGAGKTTTVHLVPRFYDVQAGVVYVAGHDVRTLSLAYLRRNVAMVLQDVFLFHGTVRENILFGRPDATEHEVLAAARAANAEEFILQLPDGYDTIIGERGVRLSGGQKQRLAIARALLKDAPILILDEATSSVDAETERQIQEALSRLKAHRTTLVIAHRLSTVRDADRIVVLERGRIVQMGTHDELVRADGLYAALYAAQEQARRWTVAAPEFTS
jgi:ATP-binding cassette subfamily B protein